MRTQDDIQTLKVMIGATPGSADLKQLVLDKIRLATNAATAQVFSQDIELMQGDVECDVGSDPARISKFRKDTATRNVLFTPERGKLFRPGAVLLSHHVVPDKEMERSEMYREVLHPLFFLMGLSVARYGTCLKGLGVQRERTQGPFGKTEWQFLRGLGPCLIQAERDEQAGRIAALVLDAKAQVFQTHRHAIVIVDQEGRILDVNHAAEPILQRTGTLLLSRRGHIQTAPYSARQNELVELIRAVASTGVARSMMLHRTGAPAVIIELRRALSVQGSMKGAPPVVALYVTLLDEGESLATSDDTGTSQDLDRAEKLRALPPRQLQIVLALVHSGKDRRVIAADLGISIHTLNTEIRTIFRRFKIHRRSELTDKLRRK